MKKNYMFLFLLLMSGFIYAQSQTSSGTFSFANETQHFTNQTKSSKAVLDSIHYDNLNGNTLGYDPGVYGFYAYYPHDSLILLNASATHLVSMKVFIGQLDFVNSFTMKIFTDTTASTLIHSQVFFPVVGWNEILLSAPIAIPATSGLFVGFEVNTSEMTHPVGCDNGPIAANGNGNWCFIEGTWHHFDFYHHSFVQNWNIRGMFGTIPAGPTALCAPLAWNAGTMILPQSATSMTFTLSNIGATGPLTCTGITGLSAPFSTTFDYTTVSLAPGTSTAFTFTYAPTVVGVDNQTIVIETNGGDITIDLSGKSIECSIPINTFPWIESFEGTTFPPNCWKRVNFSGWFGFGQVADGETMYSTTPGVMSIPTANGSKAAFCSNLTNDYPGYSDQWFITPQIAVQDNQDLSFYVFFQSDGFFFYDTVDVKISTTSNDPADFTTTLMNIYTGNIPWDTWVKGTINLSEYAGQNVYIAFNEHVPNHFTCGTFFALDVVTIDVASGIDETNEELVSIFPNPANDQINIIAENIKTVEIFNIVGKKVATYNNEKVINTSDLAVGSYIIVVVTDSKVVTKKINIVR